jgi:hypothetical protein
MEFILFIHNNADSSVTDEQWASFINTAKQSGLFLGGSEISNQIQLGNKPVKRITDSIGGFMRFEADNEYMVLELLEKHPIFKQGGTLELCEMPKS